MRRTQQRPPAPASRSEWAAVTEAVTITAPRLTAGGNENYATARRAQERRSGIRRGQVPNLDPRNPGAGAGTVRVADVPVRQRASDWPGGPVTNLN